jgi:hypothetical protein
LNCNFRNVIIITSEFTKSYFVKNGVRSKIFVIPQGYSKSSTSLPQKFGNFSIVYASPYIYSKNDAKFSINSHWSVDLFVSRIIPRMVELDPNIDIYLIGRTGSVTRSFLKKFSNGKLMGLLPINQTSQLLAKCHIGLYPRTYDSNRQSQKITEYIGAGLTIVTFNLIDSNLVQELNRGISVDVGAVDKFVESIINFKKSVRKRQKYEIRINEIKK